MNLKSVSEVARDVGCRPRDVSDAFYGHLLDDSRIVVVAGRRAIPSDYIPEIRRVLVAHGKCKEAACQR